MTELDKIVADISAKLGVRLFFREESRAEKEDVCAAGGRSDGKHTYFRFSFHGKDYTGVLDGATKTEKNYAALLPAYIAAFEEKNGELTKEEYLKKLYGDKETYALRNSTFSTYSILTPDGEWLEPGTMGWFGISSATANEEREWYKSYQSIIKKFAEENPDYVVTLVDCHI